MATTYMSPNTTKRRIPTVQPISWPAAIPQLLALSAAMTVGWFVMESLAGVMGGATVYLIYSVGSRKLLLSAHRHGLRLLQNQQYDDAIRAHETSYDFFTRHSWLDRYRAITMMSPSAMSYREMALINIAFAYGQIGNSDKVREYYQRAIDEFPNSGMAIAALRLIESMERSNVENEDVT